MFRVVGGAHRAGVALPRTCRRAPFPPPCQVHRQGWGAEPWTSCVAGSCLHHQVRLQSNGSWVSSSGGGGGGGEFGSNESGVCGGCPAGVTEGTITGQGQPAAAGEPPHTPSSSPRKRMSLTIRSPSQRARRRDAHEVSAPPPASGDSSCGASDSRSSAEAPQSASGRPTCVASGTSSSPAPAQASESAADRHPLSVVRDDPRSGPADHHHHFGGGGGNAMGSLGHFTEPVKRIILIRNGRSEANEDVSTYVSTPDWRIPLVEDGKRECVAAGHRLAELVGDEPVYVYYSPYIRSRQSLRYVLQGYDEARQAKPYRQEWWEADDHFGNGASGADIASSVSGRGGGAPPRPVVPSLVSPALTPNKLHDTNLILRSGRNNRIIGVREDVRLRDGDIGRYRSTQELIHHLEERERYGKFFYRFPYGESGADVCDRVTSFLDAFQRERVEFPMDTNVVVITHGLTIRMVIKRWFHLTVDTFHKMHSPASGSIVTLTRLHHKSCFRLDDSCVECMNLPLSLNEHNGYKYRNKRLLGSMSSGAPYM